MTWHVESWQFFSIFTIILKILFSQSYWRYYFHNHIYHNQILHLPWWRGEHWSLPCCTFRSKHSLREQVIILLIMKTVWSDFWFLRVFFWRLPLLQLLLNMYKFSNIITLLLKVKYQHNNFKYDQNAWVAAPSAAQSSKSLLWDSPGFSGWAKIIFLYHFQNAIRLRRVFL